MLLPYLRDGVDAGDKCVAALGEHDHTVTLRSLDDIVRGDVRQAISRGQLECRGLHNGITAPRHYDAERVLELWDVQVRTALEEGYGFVRLCLEGTWWLPQLPRQGALVDCERALDRYAGWHAQSVLCLYDTTHFTDVVIAGVLSCHPRVLVNGFLFDNPCYRSPDAARITVSPPRVTSERGERRPDARPGTKSAARRYE
jgi:hypothetical protein